MRTRSLLLAFATLATATSAFADEAAPAPTALPAAPRPDAPSPDAPPADTSPSEASLPATKTSRVVVSLEQEDLPRRVETPKSDGFLERYARESARVTPLPLDPDFAVFSLHGEYQLRFRAMTDLPLEPPLRGAFDTLDGSEPKDPGLLGQNAYLYHWLRLGGRIALRDELVLVAQADAVRGLVAGDTTQFVDMARDPLADDAWYEIHPRELYLEYRAPIGVFRVGQQTGYWGMGLLANDGNRTQLFGDYMRGQITERALFATKPMGEDAALNVIVAGDLVFEDNTADLLGNSPEQPNGDLASQAIAAVLWREDTQEVGIYGVYRHQERPQTVLFRGFDETLDVGVVDVTGKIRRKLPSRNAFVHAQAEAALIGGRTTYVRSAFVNQLTPSSTIEPEAILSFGSAVEVGYTHVADDERGTYGDLVIEGEWGYASGDADPFDGATHRFTFDTSRNVGLVLFDHVIGWQTARSATIAGDPRIVGRPNPGLQLLPSQGGVTGATYVNPRVIVRPMRELDVKLGMVVAHATADVVDPYHAGALGSYANFRGGDARSRDYGVELDAGVDGRIPIERTVSVEAGIEGGILFPGGALRDARGADLPKQMVLNTRLGLQF